MSNMEHKTMDSNDARKQAKAQYNVIRELVDAMREADAADDYRLVDAVMKHHMPLHIECRGDWYSRGEAPDGPVEYRITVAPGVQIRGQLDEDGDLPITARLEYCDDRTLWTRWRGPDVPADAEDILLTYARWF